VLVAPLSEAAAFDLAVVLMDATGVNSGMMRFSPKVFLVLALVVTAAGGEWRTFTDKTGRTLEAQVVNVAEGHVMVKLKSNGRVARIGFDKLSEKDLEFLRDSPVAVDGEGQKEEEPPIGRLYPRGKREIRETIQQIKNRAKPAHISQEVHEATQHLNVFRYLSGLSHDVQADSEFSGSAEKAALASEKHGALSHDIGDYTDKCNLYSGKEMMDSVSAYIEDAGPNNREQRGHRAWCLNPPMKKVGFGSGKSGYSAMWCMNADGKPARGIWSYPGAGLYPIEYMLGDAWSLYGIEVPDALDKLEIRVFRLAERPVKPFTAGARIPGREIRVRYKSKALMNGVNFEPDEAAEKGVYWVVVRGPGIREAYLVEFF